VCHDEILPRSVTVKRVGAAVVQHDLAQPPDAALDSRAAIERYGCW
jgi:hypothetical protein